MPKKIIKDVFLREREETAPLNEELKVEKTRRGRFFLKVVFVFIFLAIIAGFGAVILGKISSATVSVILQNEYLDINSDLKAHDNPAVNGLAFEIMQMDAEKSQPITATGIAKGGHKASGKIIIYNNFSSASQRLIATTRFQTKDGKTYRIPQAAVVPGMGSTEALVYADAPGESYNIGLVDFTIPGLKGGPRYEKIFAKSKTEMKGGSSGNARIVRQEDIASVKSELADNIKKELIAALSQKKPVGYLLYGNAIKINYIDNAGNPKAGDVAGDSLVYKTKGNATGYLLKKDDLSKALVENNVKKLKRSVGGNDELNIENLDGLKLELVSADKQDKEISLNLSGSAHFVWGLDAKKLAEDLASLKKKDYNQVFQNYSGIKKAVITMKPSWWRKLPGDPSKIKINFVEDKKE